MYFFSFLVLFWYFSCSWFYFCIFMFMIFVFFMFMVLFLYSLGSWFLFCIFQVHVFILMFFRFMVLFLWLIVQMLPGSRSVKMFSGELILSHKLKFSNPYIFAKWWCNSLILKCNRKDFVVEEPQRTAKKITEFSNPVKLSYLDFLLLNRSTELDQRTN